MYDSSSNTSPLLLEAAQLEDFLISLKQTQQVDLTGYKRSTLLRRTKARMQQVKVKHYQDYLDYLKQQPDEVTHFLNAVFINYTFFFRDRPVWDKLANHVIPQIIRNKAQNEPIRVWSAGCASGEETYSLAILLIEALGIEQFWQRVRIYATDVDSDALLQARKGYYSRRAVAEVPSDFLERYFEQKPDGYHWRQQFRHPIIFCQHDLIQSPPLLNIDLLVCRNTLIYFIPETQLRTLVRFHFSLQQHGFLVLGEAENPLSYLKQVPFTSMSLKAKIFTKGLVDCDRQLLLNSIAHPPVFNAGLSEQQFVQWELMQSEVKWLREQVRSLKEELRDRLQQQHEIEQELKATKQELESINQEIQHGLRTR